MSALPAGLAAIAGFLETGGPVMGAIGIVSLVMWTLILERFWYLRRVHPGQARALRERWRRLPERDTWHAQQIREQWISEVRLRLRRSVPMIRTLVMLCPMLGLLGTVVGMMEVFDAMSISGNSSVRATASGVSKATLTTMAGMVAALSGLFFSISLERAARLETQRLAAELAHR